MFDFPCCMTQGNNALIIWISINLVHVTVISHHKLINSHTYVSSLKNSLFLSTESCYFIYLFFFFEAWGQILRSMFCLVRPNQVSRLSVDTSAGIHLLACYSFLNLYVLLIVTVGFCHLKLLL